MCSACGRKRKSRECAGLREQGVCMWRYIKIETKRLIHILPGFLISVLTLTLFTLLLLFLAQRFLPEILTVMPFRVGLCVEGDDPISNYVNQYIRQMESAEGLIEFQELSAREVFEEQKAAVPDGQETRMISRRKVQDLLAEKQLTACIVIPERTAQSVMDGTNIPVQVIMAPGMGQTERYLQERLLALLTECGAVMIDVPQAETLLLYEMQVGNPEELGQTLDLFHFGLVFGREDWFATETISAFGSAELEEYYLAAGGTLLFLFWGLGCGSFFRKREDNMPLLLERSGVMLPCQQGVRQGLYVLWHLVLVIVLFFVLAAQGNVGGGIGGGAATGIAVFWIPGVFCAAMLALQTSFLFEAAPTTGGGILLNVVAGLLGFFGAGGILPPVFLPKAVTDVCGRLPVGICLEWLLRNIAGNGGSDGKMVGFCVLWCLVFGAAGQFVFCAKQRRYHFVS